MRVTVCVDWNGRALEVTGFATSGYRGSFFEPPCPPEFEIIRAEDEDGDDVKLSREERDELESLCLRTLDQQAEDDRAEALIEREIYRRAA
ncbi:hypothetical protein [Niveibacterium terrae]|uniref:hypothetical protein n=1 Tax=Niveibacterium terrae TaxID=3373598 RepID=UPI003A952271